MTGRSALVALKHGGFVGLVTMATGTEQGADHTTLFAGLLAILAAISVPIVNYFLDALRSRRRGQVVDHEAEHLKELQELAATQRELLLENQRNADLRAEVERLKERRRGH